MQPRNRPKITQAIQAELISILYRNLPVSIIGLMIVAPVLFWQLSGSVSYHYLMLWYSSLCAVVIGRYILLIWYRRTRHLIRLQAAHYHLFVLGSSLTACLWGIMGSFLLPPDDPVSQDLIFIIIIGVVSGGIMSLHASYYACVNYIVFGFGPTLVWLGLHVLIGEEEYLGLFLVGLTYGLFVEIDAYRGYAILVNNLRLNLENADLNVQLNESNLQLVQKAEDLKQRQKMIEILTDMGEYLPTCISEQEVYSIFTQYVEKLLPEYSGALAVFKDSRKQLNNVAVWGSVAPPKDLVFLPTDCWALRKGQPFMSHMSSQKISCNHLELHDKESLCVPMMASGETLGILSIIFDPANPPLVHHQGIINRLIGDVSLALANVRLKQSLQELSVHDVLTGLYNRRYLEDSLTQFISRARRKKSNFSLFMFDIDYFKQVNDKYGHDGGDAVLRELGRITKQYFRESDLCFRYGGEEFVVILEDSTSKAALKRAEDFRQAVKNIRVQIGAQVIIEVSISGGVSTYPENGETGEELITAADKALYKAKNAGRDNISKAS